MFNVKRTYPAPASLANKRSYKEEDVVEALSAIFFDKCYICEIKEPTVLNVEHFVAHQGDADKEYDWDNLFYVCGRCNNIKLQYYNNLLNCTDSSGDAFMAIKHLPPIMPHSKVVIEAMNSEDCTQQTASLLDRVFNSDSTINKKITASYLRKKVFRKVYRLIESARDYFDDESSDRKKNDALELMQTLMSKKQEFSAFIRWTALSDEKLRPLLLPYMD